MSEGAEVDEWTDCVLPTSTSLWPWPQWLIRAAHAFDTNLHPKANTLRMHYSRISWHSYQTKRVLQGLRQG